MSPIEYIAEGIRQGNWETVCQGYERLTGEALPLPVVFVMKNEAEDVLCKIADIIIKSQLQASSILTKQTIELRETPKKKSSSRPRKNKKKKITVISEGEDSSLQLDDNKRTKVQKEIGKTQLITNKPDEEEIKRNKYKAEKAKLNKVRINRKPITKYDVSCNECEKIFRSDRPQGEMGQKCDRCLREKKTRLV